MRKFFIKYKDFFSIDFVILLFTFFFISNIFFVICITPIPLALFDIIINDTDFAVILAVIFSFILAKIVLPIIYYFLENKSNNNLVKKIIITMKTKWKYRLITLIVVSLFPFSNTNKNAFSFINIQFVCSGFISFLILFLWWDIQKFIKKIKNKT